MIRPRKRFLVSELLQTVLRLHYPNGCSPKQRRDALGIVVGVVRSKMAKRSAA